jgi:NADH-quinone oxidoreductase subunit E
MTLNAEEIANLEKVKQSLGVFEKQRGNLIPILQLAQKQMTYLPAEVINVVADYLELNVSEVYGVATFYNQFRFNPPGRNPIKVCLGTACHVKGGDIIIENFERKLNIKEGQTTPDREFSLERVACVGCCALAPVATVGDTLHGHMAPSKVEGLIMRVQIEKEMAQRASQKDKSGE